ncbi:zinc finger CCCH domain-containing protein 6-like [Corythoichthys intestinalis]|uniref:zinc finger CCCH domain-containing protein 6-like n=1 Tax=Corythoichthys intestinalis TaxID=161448 RepID=UPI0025A548F8|nr:zinc finger CCCH domain-containing protein 6-like [Corythoichthys intestinalis]
MSFTNLFAALPVISVKSSDQPALKTIRDDTFKVQRHSKGRKRARSDELPLSYIKRRCHWTQECRTDIAPFSQDDSKTAYRHAKNTYHEKREAAFSKDVCYSKQNGKTNHNVNQQQQDKRKNHQRGQQEVQKQHQDRGGCQEAKGPSESGTRTEQRNHRRYRNERPRHYHWTQESRTDFAPISQNYSNAAYRLAKKTDHKKETGFSNDVAYNYDNKVCHSAQDGKTNQNVNQQQEGKRENYQKGQHKVQKWHQNRGGRQHAKHPRKSGTRTEQRNRMRNRDKKPAITYFSPEFKEQNTVLLNGKLFCRHFLFGKCIKEEGCKLLHIQACNDLIKEPCKYYKQQACLKGEQCPYMHKSFPCKYFHKKGRCSNRDDCKFSHEPLNDITMKLLNEDIERDMELAKKANEALVQSTAVDESVINPLDTSQEQKAGDKLVEPFRFNFYNSAESNADCKEICVTEGVIGAIEGDAQQQPECKSPLVTPCSEPPALYSVEAVLGPPLPTFFKTPSDLPTSSGCSSSPTPSKVSYSVDVVLKSPKSTQSFTLSHTSTNTTAMQQVAPSALPDESGPPSQNNKSSDMPPIKNETNTELCKTRKNTAVVKVQTSSKISKGEKSAEYIIPEAERHTDCLKKEEYQQLTTEIPSSSNCTQLAKSCKVEFRRLFSSPPDLVSTPKDSQRFMLHHSYQTNDINPPSSSTQSSTPLKETAGAPTAPASPSSKANAYGKLSNHLPLQCLYSQNTKSALPARAARANSTIKRKTDRLSLGSNKSLETPFKSLFASSIADSQNSTPENSTITSSAHNSTQSISASSKSTNVKCQDSSEKRVEATQARASSLRSLFATPLSELEALHNRCVSQANHSNKLGLSLHPVESESPVPSFNHITKVSQAASSTENDRSVDPKQNKEMADRKTPSSPVRSAVNNQLSVRQSYIGSSPKATSTSVLKTLFLSLSPYQQDTQ